MKQKYIEIPYNTYLAQKIQSGEFPGVIVNSAGSRVRIIDFTHSSSGILCMVMDSVFLEETEIVYKAGELRIQAPEWVNFSGGDVVMCEQRCGDCIIECLAILRTRPDYLTNNRVYIYSMAKCITCGNTSPSEAILDVNSSTFHTVRRANEVERKLFAERLKQNASEPALTMLAKYLPEYSNVKQPQRNE